MEDTAPSNRHHNVSYALLSRMAGATDNLTLYHRAISRIHRQDFAGAITLLERVIQREDRDPALARLGPVIAPRCNDHTLLSHALLVLEEMFFYGRGTPIDLTRALALDERAAALGNAQAAFHVALFHHGKVKTWPGPRDPDKAARYYAFAADAGHSHAITNLAILHACELIHGANREHGERILRRQAAAGDEEARRALATLAFLPPLKPSSGR